jgi:anti-anti-sigma factor
MRITHEGGVLSVSDVDELDAAHALSFQMAVAAALAPSIERIEIDLSRTGRVDCGGVGALVALRKCARRCNSNANVRVRNPSAPVRRVLHLTRLDDWAPLDGEQNPLALAACQSECPPESLQSV